MTIYKVDELCSAHPELFQRSQIVFILLCTMFAAWLCDTFAYFFGRTGGIIPTPEEIVEEVKKIAKEIK